MRRTASILVVVAVLAVGHVAFGVWSLGTSGSGAVGAMTMPGGNVPSASVSGHDVTLTWTAGQFAGGGNVPGYVVKRYDGLTNALQSVLSGCAGLVGTAGCTENAVPTGSWKYTITPAAGNNWRGTESGQSALVLVLL